MTVYVYDLIRQLSQFPANAQVYIELQPKVSKGPEFEPLINQLPDRDTDWVIIYPKLIK